MHKYRKKPVVVEAELYQPGMEDGYKVYEKDYPEEGCCFVYSRDLQPFHSIVCPAIYTLEGWHEISPGDYIITGIKGERYPCKPDIFEQTYEPVEEGDCN